MTLKYKYIGHPEKGQDCSQFYAVIGIDAEGNEGICGVDISGKGVMPIVFSQWRLWENHISSLARQIVADNPTMRLELRKYDTFEVVEEITA